jgi:hypothetical protein
MAAVKVKVNKGPTVKAAPVKRRSEFWRLVGAVFKALWKLTRFVGKQTWRLTKVIAIGLWKTIRWLWGGVAAYFKPYQKQKRLTHVFLPRAVIALSMIGALVVAVWTGVQPAQSIGGAQAGTSGPCVLAEQVDHQIIRRFWHDVRQWCPIIMEAGSKYGLDPHLIAVVISMESAGNPTAYSKSGAVGLMQVMPRDGLAASFQCPNGPCFANRPTITELQDPAFNVDFGTQLLAFNVARTGSLREALRSYGPMGVGYKYADDVLSVYERVKPKAAN